MYIVIMDSDKQLIPTIKQAIYRGENMMDDVKFLLPLTYKKFDLSEFTVTLQYIQNKKIVYEEILIELLPTNTIKQTLIPFFLASNFILIIF